MGLENNDAHERDHLPSFQPPSGTPVGLAGEEYWPDRRSNDPAGQDYGVVGGQDRADLVGICP